MKPILRCAVLDDYQDVARKYGDWTSLEGRIETTVFNDHIEDRSELIERLTDFHIVCAMRERTRFDEQTIRALPNLQLLVTTGRYNHSIDHATCSERGILVCGTGDVHGAAAELTWGLILSLVRHIPAEDRDFKDGARWQPRLGHSLADRTLGVLGFGRLGQRVTRVARAFGMEVLVWSKSITQSRTAPEGAVAAGSLDELLSRSDVVTIHLRLNTETRGLLGARELGLMKPSSFLVNTSRGPIIQETALIEALNAGRLAGVALDVFDKEPLPSDHPLRKIDRVVGTPHVGFVTEETYGVFFHDVVEDIACWLKGEPIRVIEARA